MSKYLETKKGSLEGAVLEAMSPAQQAATAISKKEKEKTENNFIHAAKMAKEKGEKTFTIGGKEYDVEETIKTEKLVGGQKKLDKDGDGDIDGKDFAAMRKKAKKEEVELQEKPADYLELEFNSSRDAAKAYDYINNKLYSGGHQPFNMQPNEGSSLQFEDMDDADKVMAELKKARFKFKVYERESVQEGYSPKEIKMAIGVASDKRYAGGNYSGAVKAIEKIKKGLSSHPQVAAVLKRQNESLAEKAARHISDMWKESAAAKDKVKEEEEDEKDPKMTMTGKPMSKVEVKVKNKED